MMTEGRGTGWPEVVMRVVGLGLILSAALMVSYIVKGGLLGDTAPIVIMLIVGGILLGWLGYWLLVTRPPRRRPLPWLLDVAQRVGFGGRRVGPRLEVRPGKKGTRDASGGFSRTHSQNIF